MNKYFTYISSNRKGFLLRVDTPVHSYVDSNATETSYYLLWIETGYWYKLNTVNESVAVNEMEEIVNGMTIPSVPPVDDVTERNIRDRYLPSVSGDNFSIIPFNGWEIWTGYNDTDELGYYFVTDGGDDIGISELSVKEAMNAIKNAGVPI